MPYQTSWNGKEVYCKFSGTVSGNELIECNLELYGNIYFDDIRWQIFDLLDVTKLNVTTDEVMIVAACDRVASMINPHVKCALVSKDETAAVLSKTYQQKIFNSPWEGKSFQGVNEARAWASCPPSRPT